MLHTVQKNELTVSQQHLLNIHQNVGPKWKPHSSVVSLLPPALLCVLAERAFEFTIPLHVSQQRLEWISTHQCTSWGWARSTRFGDEPKPHLDCPNIYFFSHLYSAPKTFLPYLPSSPLLPPPSYLPPTSYLQSPSPEHHSESRSTIVGVGAPELELFSWSGSARASR